MQAEMRSLEQQCVRELVELPLFVHKLDQTRSIGRYLSKEVKKKTAWQATSSIELLSHLSPPVCRDNYIWPWSIVIHVPCIFCLNHCCSPSHTYSMSLLIYHCLVSEVFYASWLKLAMNLLLDCDCSTFPNCLLWLVSQKNWWCFWPFSLLSILRALI